MEDGSVWVANNLDGPGWRLDETTTDQSYDGWKWFDEPEKAYAYFAFGEDRISPRQIRLALLQHNIDPEMIDNMVANNPVAKIEWQHATFVQRNHPLVMQLGEALGLTEQQIDDLFVTASGL